MPTNRFAERFVIEKLRSAGPCFFDDHLSALPFLSRADVFIAVDQLVRDGYVVLRLLDYAKLKYEVFPTSKLETHTTV